MTITVRRRGGFAGIDERLASVDLGTLPGAVAQQLRDGMARLDALIAGGQPSVGADQIEYAIEIAEAGAPPRTITVIDEGDPDQAAMKQVRAVLRLLGLEP